MTDQLAQDPNGVARRVFRDLPRRYDALAEVLSFGQNRRWRLRMLEAVLAGTALEDRSLDDGAPREEVLCGRPRLALDVATGTAGVAISIVHGSDAQVVAVDLSEEMLGVGRRRVTDAGLETRIRLARARGEDLPFPDGAFDCLTFTYLLRYVEDPVATVEELARVVRTGGVIASLEFFVPPKVFWRFWWFVYTRLVLPVAGLLTGGAPWYRVGRFLGPSISEHYRSHPLSATVGAWQRAGITGVEARLMSLGGGLVMWGTKTGG